MSAETGPPLPSRGMSLSFGNAPLRASRYDVTFRHGVSNPETSADGYTRHHGSDAVAEHQSLCVKTAFKNLFQGAIHPLIAMVKHPVATVCGLAATVALSAAAPITIPIMVLAGLGFGGFQLGKGMLQVISRCRQGDMRGAEQAFYNVGEGSTTLSMSLLGVRQTGALAAEARVTHAALKAASTAADKLKAVEAGVAAASQVKQGGWGNALAEHVRLLTRKEGWKVMGHQLNPRQAVGNGVGMLKEFGQMFKTPVVFDLQAELKMAQAHLGLKDSDMPAMVARPFEKTDWHPIYSLFYTPKKAAASYRIPSHEIHFPSVESHTQRLISSRLPYIGEPLARAYPRLPRFMQNYLSHWANRQMSLRNGLQHELTHARQYLNATRLTKTEALAALHASADPKLKALTAHDLWHYQFAQSSHGMSPGSRAKAIEDLQGLIQSGTSDTANGGRAGMSRYVLSLAESEARQVPVQIEQNAVMARLNALGTTATPREQVVLMQQLRQNYLEMQTNALLMQLQQLKSAGASSVALENVTAALSALQKVNGQTHLTGRLVHRTDILPA